MNFNLKSRSAQAACGDRRGLPRRSRLVVEGGAAAGSAGGRLPAPLAAGTGTGTAAVWNPGPACPRAWWQGRWLLRLPPGPWGRGWRSKLWYLPVLRLAWPGASLRFEQLEGPLPQCPAPVRSQVEPPGESIQLRAPSEHAQSHISVSLSSGSPRSRPLTRERRIDRPQRRTDTVAPSDRC